MTDERISNERPWLNGLNVFDVRLVFEYHILNRFIGILWFYLQREGIEITFCIQWLALNLLRIGSIRSKPGSTEVLMDKIYFSSVSAGARESYWKRWRSRRDSIIWDSFVLLTKLTNPPSSRLGFPSSTLVMSFNTIPMYGIIGGATCAIF